MVLAYIGIVIGVIILIALIVKLLKSSPMAVLYLNLHCKKCGYKTNGLKCPKCDYKKSFGI
jgi:predicted Zn-ribbon and HTH transcriptional regulator